MPVLYGSPLSPFVRKVAVVLEEKGITYEWKQLRPHNHDPEFCQISPLGKIPAYKDDRAGLADSSVICFYLEKTHPEPTLYPSDTLELCRALWFEEYFDSGMYGPMSTIYVERWMKPRIYGKPTDEVGVKEAMEVKLPPLLAYLERELEGKTWMAGSHFSIADISLAMGFVNLQMASYQLDAKSYPRLATHVARIHERPSFRKCARAIEDYIDRMKEKWPVSG